MPDRFSIHIVLFTILSLTFLPSYSMAGNIPQSPAGGKCLDLRGQKQVFYYAEDIDNCFDGEFFENGMTLEFWFCPARVTKPGEWSNLVSKPIRISPYYKPIYDIRLEHWLIIRDDTTEWMTLNEGGGLWDLVPGKKYEPTWYNIILQGRGVKNLFCDGNNVCVNGISGIAFLDGVSSGAFGSGGTGYIFDSDLPLYVGGLPPEARTSLHFGRDYKPFNVTTFDGLIDELRISNIIRYPWKNPGEKINIKNHLLPDEHTVALWHFDEGPGAFRYEDASGNGHTLLIGGQFGVSYAQKLPACWASIKKGD